jgi:UDPglucose 6-dehydrogenase
VNSTIAIIGTGYVGLTTGAYLAHLGHTVVCADVDADKVRRLSRGEVPIFEAGLDDLVREGLDAGRLSFVVGAGAAVAEAEFVFLCVQTPQGDDGAADLTYIRQAAEEVGPELRPECIVINKSTVPVGSTRVVEAAIERDDVFVVSNPEFLREGSAVHDCLNPDRIVIGSDDQAAAMRVAGLFESLKAPLVITDPASAETIKYASNAFLATKISYVNAVANVCEAVGADVREVVLGMGYDKRIGFEFLKPGPGWGGSCFVGTETVLAAHGDEIRLLTFEQLFSEVERAGSEGWSVLSWVPGEVTAELLPVSAFTARPWSGDVLEVRTKMGRRVTTTPCHPFVVGDGHAGRPPSVKRADELTTTDWLPVAQGLPVFVDERTEWSPVLDGLEAAGIPAEKVIVHLSDTQRRLAGELDHLLPSARREDSRRTGSLRLQEVRMLGLPEDEGAHGTVDDGTFVPPVLHMDHDFWRMVGLYLAEGHVGADGDRRRICWSFHPTDESALVDEVVGYWTGVGVKTTVRNLSTARQVSISSRILASWFEHVLGVGSESYSKRVPDVIWTAPESAKRELLRGLWDGDGSWSRVSGGPGVVLEYGTASRALADGMLRLFGDLGVTARLKVDRTATSTVDTYWLTISGADQVDESIWLLPEDERVEVRRITALQSTRIAPTGYRRLPESKNAAWVRVTRLERRRHEGIVYSLEVPGAHTVVTSFGLVSHNCFPKDTRAMVHIAEEAGYDFGLLKGVITVNDEQYERMADKVERMAGGSVEGCVVAAWGLTFKARTDDIRDSPAIAVIRRLQERGAIVRAYDPAIEGTRPGLEGIDVQPDPYAACEGAEVLAVLTEWDEFRWLDFAKVAGLMHGPRIVDTRNLLEPAAVRRRGFAYDGLGRA